jgi:hypothetical protein
MNKLYSYQHRKLGYTTISTLTAYWEVEFSAIQNEYPSSKFSAIEIFNFWIEHITKYSDSNLLLITWQLENEDMPYQHCRKETGEDFLTYYTHPIYLKTGKKVNFLDIPVANYLSNRHKATYNSEFIQKVTGWKPSILQPYIYLPALLQALHLNVSHN